jgi:hypothetical protein
LTAKLPTGILAVGRPPRKKEEHSLSLTLVEKRKRIRIIHHA